MSLPYGGQACPQHGAEKMRESNKIAGMFYCSAKLADGTWCKHKTKAPEPAAAPQPAPEGAAPRERAGSEFRYAAALDFAAKVYAGSADSDKALKLAQAVVATWPS